MSKGVVVYLRSSSKLRGAGLRLEEQRKDVEAFCRENCTKVLAEFKEREHHGRSDRPFFRAALARAKAAGAPLVIPRLDRLWHDAGFVKSLDDSGVEFKALDVPSVNLLPLSVVVAAAEEEHEALSLRTKAALKSAAAAGVALGARNPKCRNLAADAAHRGGINSRVSRRDKRDKAIAAVADTIKALRAKGYSYGTVAAALNQDGYLTTTGRRWRAPGVRRAAQRIP
jgi:DNA invertase Pin-like site-specific DNA recombinase